MPESTHQEREYSVLSTSTILILSGFLLGISVAEPLGEFSFYIFTCGTTGLIAYLALSMAEIRQERTTVRHDQRLMDARLQRHVRLATTLSSEEETEKNRLLDWLKRETEALSR